MGPRVVEWPHLWSMSTNFGKEGINRKMSTKFSSFSMLYYKKKYQIHIWIELTAVLAYLDGSLFFVEFFLNGVQIWLDAMILKLVFDSIESPNQIN